MVFDLTFRAVRNKEKEKEQKEITQKEPKRGKNQTTETARLRGSGGASEHLLGDDRRLRSGTEPSNPWCCRPKSASLAVWCLGARWFGG